MTEAPTKDDAIRLREHLDAAISVCEQINCDGDYPEYPSAIGGLMRYITSSPWGNHQYKPTETKKILMRLDTANLDEIRSALTAVSRSERFCTGAWKNA
jgi:hypothetical protein